MLAAMKVIAILAQKGGTGKSTLAAHLAVEAERVGPKPVAMIDLDPQASLRRWYEKRGQDRPVLLESGRRARRPGRHDLSDMIKACRDADVGLVVVDTAPHVLETASNAAAVADLVVIPTRAGIMDIEAIGATVDIVQDVSANAAIVLNAVRPRGSLIDEAREALAVYELPICPTAIVNRAALADALIDGRGVQEMDPKGKGAGEVKAVWRWLKARM